MNTTDQSLQTLKTIQENQQNRHNQKIIGHPYKVADVSTNHDNSK